VFKKKKKHDTLGPQPFARVGLSPPPPPPPKDETGNAVTVTPDRRVNMLNEFFFLQLQCRDIDIATTYFQQVGATVHSAWQSMHT